MSTQKVRFVLSPGLSDGQHECVVDSTDAVLDAVTAWLMDSGDSAGESFTVSTKYLSDDELQKLPDL